MMDTIDFSKLKRCVTYYKNGMLEWKMCTVNKSHVCDEPPIKAMSNISEKYPSAVWQCYSLLPAEIEAIKKKYSI
jgi:hypothetical protein